MFFNFSNHGKNELKKDMFDSADGTSPAGFEATCGLAAQLGVVYNTEYATIKQKTNPKNKAQMKKKKINDIRLDCPSILSHLIKKQKPPP